jgi:hypothetical protein
MGTAGARVRLFIDLMWWNTLFGASTLRARVHQRRYSSTFSACFDISLSPLDDVFLIARFLQDKIVAV